MELEIQTWGEDAAIRLPAEFLKQMNLKVGDKFTVETYAVGALLLKRKPSCRISPAMRHRRVPTLRYGGLG